MDESVPVLQRIDDRYYIRVQLDFLASGVVIAAVATLILDWPYPYGITGRDCDFSGGRTNRVLNQAGHKGSGDSSIDN